MFRVYFFASNYVRIFSVDVNLKFISEEQTWKKERIIVYDNFILILRLP